MCFSKLISKHAGKQEQDLLENNILVRKVESADEKVPFV